MQVLEKFAGSATLWLRFISYIKGNQSRFSVSKVRATYTTAIKRTLSGSGGIVNSDSVAKAEQSALLIFRDLAEFERCCGYTERALSLWQALVELCLFCPPAPPGNYLLSFSSIFAAILLNASSGVTKKDLLRSFWDSGVPRLGEEGHVG